MRGDPSSPLFECEDVDKTKHPLMRLLRLTLYKLGYTQNMLIRMHKNYYSDYKLDESTRRHHLENLRKRITETDITWRQFVHVLSDILNIRIKRVSITFDICETAIGADGKSKAVTRELTIHSDEAADSTCQTQET
jgi:arginyl-tRNA synthetase